jgi:putative Mg2+ transporter-C (MgtC) family protein
MQTLLHTQLSLTEILLRLVLAAMVGAVIGIDREIKNRPAGLRTHMMTALAAAVFTILTSELHHLIVTKYPGSNADPLRVIEAVTAGVAFLAAGTIFQARGQVEGITTGAGMWLAGALGLACGAGFHLLAVIGLAIAMVIMTILRPIERKLWPSQPPARDRTEEHRSGDSG